MQYDIDFWWRIDIHRITNYIRLLSTLSNTSLTSKFFKTGFNRLYLLVCANNTMSNSRCPRFSIFNYYELNHLPEMRKVYLLLIIRRLDDQFTFHV